MMSVWLLIIMMKAIGGDGGLRSEVVVFANLPMCEKAREQVLTMSDRYFKIKAVCVHSR